MIRIPVRSGAVLFLLAASHSIAFAVSPDENLDRWRAASGAAQSALARALVRHNTSGLSGVEIRARAVTLDKCIDGVAGDGALDNLKIAEVAGTCATMLGLKN